MKRQILIIILAIYINNKPNQKHHFLTNKNSHYTGKFRDIVSKYGLDLNKEWNIEEMPHLGRHPNAYHEYMLKHLEKIDKEANLNVDKFMKLFEKLKDVIKDNPAMLTAEYWRVK